MKSGDMKESELLAEASELMKKMKDMPGMGDLQGMLSKMGMSAGKGSGKVNVSAMQSNLDQKLKKSQNSERLLKKLEEKRAQQLQAQQQRSSQWTSTSMVYVSHTEMTTKLKARQKSLSR